MSVGSASRGAGLTVLHGDLPTCQSSSPGGRLGGSTMGCFERALDTWVGGGGGYQTVLVVRCDGIPLLIQGAVQRGVGRMTNPVWSAGG